MSEELRFGKGEPLLSRKLVLLRVRDANCISLMAALLAGPTLLHAEFKGDLSKSPLVGNRLACLLFRLTASISVNCQTLSFP